MSTTEVLPNVKGGKNAKEEMVLLGDVVCNSGIDV
jgi:hypothetical protein